MSDTPSDTPKDQTPQTRTARGYKIDPMTGVITPITITVDDQHAYFLQMYALIGSGCELVDNLHLGDGVHVMWDESANGRYGSSLCTCIIPDYSIAPKSKTKHMPAVLDKLRESGGPPPNSWNVLGPLLVFGLDADGIPTNAPFHALATINKRFARLCILKNGLVSCEQYEFTNSREA